MSLRKLLRANASVMTIHAQDIIIINIPISIYFHYYTVKLTVKLSDVTRSARVLCVWISVRQQRLLKVSTGVSIPLPVWPAWFGVELLFNNIALPNRRCIDFVTLNLNIFFTMIACNVQTTTFIMTLQCGRVTPPVLAPYADFSNGTTH